MDEKVAEEIQMHKETIATDSNTPLHLIREKEIEISGSVLAAKRQADEIVTEARKKAAEVVSKAEAEGGSGAAVREDEILADADKEAARLQGGGQDRGRRTRCSDRYAPRRSGAARVGRRDHYLGWSRRGVLSPGRVVDVLVPMAKVEIIGPKSLFLDVVSALHEQGKIHIEDLSKRIASGEVALDRMEIQGDELKVYDQLDELLMRVRAILKTLNEPEEGVDPKVRVIEYERLWQLSPPELADEITTVIADVEEKTADLAALHTAAESEISLLSRYEPILGKIQPLAKQLVVTGAFDSVALLVERRYKAGLEHLQVELDKVTNSQCEILSTDIDEQTTAAIVVYARQYAEPVHKFLAMENVNQIRLPQDFQDMPLDVAYETIRTRKAELPAELDSIRGRARRDVEQVVHEAHHRPRRPHGRHRRDPVRSRSSDAPTTRS